MSHDDSDEHLTAAFAAIDNRQHSPSDALAAALAILERPDISTRARLVSLWALGAAERELNRLESSEEHLREAIELGVQIGDAVVVAQVSSALVVVVTARGRLTEALELADSIRASLPANERGEP